jgi:hypothetical protein
LDIEADKV